MEERLDPHYFSTTPKNSWELFKWIFTEPIKLEIFSNSISKKEILFWFLKTYIWIGLFISFIFLFFNVVIVLSDIPIIFPNYFSNYIVKEWENLSSVNDKFFFLLNLKIIDLIKSTIISFLISIIMIFINNKLLVLKQLSSVFFITISLNLVLSILSSFLVLPSISLGIIIGLIGMTVGQWLFDYARDFSVELVLEIIYISIIYLFLITLFFGLVSGIISAYIFFLSFMLSRKGVFQYFPYLFYWLITRFKTYSLKNNPYLNHSHIYFPIIFLDRALIDDSYIKPNLGYDFSNFLIKFRPHQEKLAIDILYIINIFYLKKYPLDFDKIKLFDNYQGDEFYKKYIISFFQKLKIELNNYKIQNNIQTKIIFLNKLENILNDFKDIIPLLPKYKKDKYLDAIEINLKEIKAKIKNLQMDLYYNEAIQINIYEIGNPLSPNYQNQLFKGRKNVVDRLSNIIYTSSEMPLLLIQGQRRVGKTSLINYLEQLLGSGFKIVKLDMQSATNKRFNSMVRNINQELNEILGIDETIETSDDMLQSWIVFEEYLTKHTKALNYKIIIAFDEYESFHKHIVKKYGEDILENMRSFMQSQNQVIFLFAGMWRLSDLTSPNWDEYFPHAQRLKVDYLSREESLELITNPVEDFNLIYTDEVAHRVYELTMGHPQLLQTICSIIVTIANETNQKEVTKEMVAKAKEEVFEVNEMPMSIFWREFCGDAEREVMEQILVKQEIIKETKEQKRAVARLVDYGFIWADMTIRVPLFEKWLVERRDLIEV